MKKPMANSDDESSAQVIAVVIMAIAVSLFIGWLLVRDVEPYRCAKTQDGLPLTAISTRLDGSITGCTYGHSVPKIQDVK